VEIGMTVKNRQDFWSGIMFVALGGAFAIVATRYSVGTTERMGPGFFPFWLGVILAALGLLVVLSSLLPGALKAEVERFNWPVALIIAGSVALTGFVLNTLGLFISVFLLVLLSSVASHAFSWKVAVLNGLVMSLFVWAAFVKGLGIVFPLWPGFFGN
jgi:hypothetical protein